MLGKIGFVWIKDTVLFQYYFTHNQNTVLGTFRYENATEQKSP